MKFSKIFISLIATAFCFTTINAQTKSELRVIANAQKKYQNVEHIYDTHLAHVTNNDKKGLLSTITGKLVTPCIYDAIQCEINNDKLFYATRNNKYGFLNTKGKLVIPCIYNFATEFSDGYSVVLKNGKWGIINKLGKYEVSLIYDNCFCSDGEGAIADNRVIMYTDDKCGLITTSGKVVIPFKYDEGFFAFTKTGCVFVFRIGETEYAFDQNGNTYNGKYSY